MNALRKRSIGGVGAIAVVALGAAACGGGAYGASHASSSSGAPTAAIHSAAVKVGSKTMTILEDSKGRPLYYYGADTGAKSAGGGSLPGPWPAALLLRRRHGGEASRRRKPRRSLAGGHVAEGPHRIRPRRHRQRPARHARQPGRLQRPPALHVRQRLQRRRHR